MMRSLFLLCMALVLLISGLGLVQDHGRAQSEQSDLWLDSLEVSLWPEYDQPSMLVIYTIILPEKTVFPKQLSLRIPTAAGNPSMVAVGPDLDNLFDINYDRQVAGMWSVIRFETPVPIIRLEYYDPSLNIQQAQRTFDFTWPGDYKTNHFYLQVQQPFGSSDLRFSPSIPNGEWASDGVLNYFSADMGVFGVDQSLKLNLTYYKESDQLSVSGLQVKSAVPITSNTPGRVTWWSSIPWLLLIPLGLVLLMVGGLWYWRLNIQIGYSRVISKKDDMNRDASEAESPHETSAVDIQCNRCGRRSNPGDKFCRSCGSQLQVKDH